MKRWERMVLGGRREVVDLRLIVVLASTENRQISDCFFFTRKDPWY